MSDIELTVCIIALALTAALPRILPVSLLANKELPDIIQKWLTFIPAAILAALVAPDIFLYNGQFDFSMDNFFLIASVPTLLVAYKTKSLFITLIVGMVCVALLRQVM